MSDEDRESTETVEDETVDTADDTTTDVTEKDDGSEEEVVGNTNDSINASLDSIKDPDVLKAMIARLRHENGNHRRGKKELEKEVGSLKDWKRDNLKKVSEANARAEKAEQVSRQYIIKAAASEYDVDEDLIDLIDGRDADEIYDRASRLANTRKEKRSYDTPTDTTLFGGKSRGTPVGPQPKTAGTDFFEDLMGRGPSPRRRS